MATDVLVLGSLISQKQENIFIHKGIRPCPSDVVQKYIIAGLNKHPSIGSVTVISSPRIPCFPHKKIYNVESSSWCFQGANIHTVGFLNFPCVGFLERERRLIVETKKWAKKKKTQSNRTILIYGIHSPFLKAAKEAKKIDKSITTTLIVADLPQYMSNCTNFKKILKKVDRYRIDKLRKYVDKYILYTKQMAEALNVPDGQWTVMEGMFDTDKISVSPCIAGSEKICVYAGSLDFKYAIDKLVKAFDIAKVDAKLHIYGDISGAKTLANLIQNSQKTEYMGILPPDEMFNVFKTATLLINPRPSDLALAKYSCPSKTFEYMASGRPVLMTRLPGVPDEYFDYLYVFDEESLDGYAKKIEEILNYDEKTLSEFGLRGQSFIICNKGVKQQTAKIMEFILR